MRPISRAISSVWAIAALGAVPLVAAADASAERAQLNYRLYCMGCHQNDGRGVPSQGIPDFRLELGRIFTAPGGRSYLVRVPGVRNTPMSSAATAEVLNWLLVTYGGQGHAAGFHPFSADEVAALRRDIPPNILAERAELLKQIADLR